MAPNVFWTLEVRRRLWALIDNVKTEVGGFGYAALEDDGKSLVWYDVFLVPQRVGSASVDYDAAGLQYAVERAARDDVLARPDHVWASWHSHNKMKAFWSPTDEECIDIYGRAGMPVLLSFVGNHDHEYEARLDLFSVEHRGITLPKVTVDGLDIKLDGDEPVDPYTRAIRAEIDEYVKEGYGQFWKGGRPHGSSKSGQQETQATLSTTRTEPVRQVSAGRGEDGDGDGGGGGGEDNGYENIGGAVVWSGTRWEDPDEAARELERWGWEDDT